jgi:bifunctional oligoribonuclease and PAP phosphatase NrnA
VSSTATTRHGLDDVLVQLQRRERFIVTSHARPDGDAVGSVLGCVKILRAMGKQAEAVLHDRVPQIYKCLPGADSVLVASEVPTGFEAAIVLECDSVQRTRLRGLESLFLINLDHHNSAKQFADINWIEQDASATAELIFKLARHAGVEITPDIATCLYTAVLTDTGSFAYAGTNATTFELARDLVRYGADPVSIAQHVYFANPPTKMLLLGAALSRLTIDHRLAWMHVTREDMARTGAAEEDCEGVVNYALGIDGIEVAAFFRESPDGKFRVSLRSKGAINVARIAETFGGGGHSCASGHAIDGPLEAATEKVLGLLRDELRRLGR